MNQNIGTIFFATNDDKVFVCIAVDNDLTEKFDAGKIIKNIVSNYTGPHYVKAIQNNHNLGINLHLERLVEIAKSDLIIWAAGDDVSFPNRANQIIKAHNSSGAKLIFSDAITHTSKGTKGSDIHKSALFYGSYNLRQTAVSFASFAVSPNWSK